jgi:hypothetical protein
VRRHGAVEGARGQVAQRLDLVAGDAGGAQRLVGSVEQELRRGIAAEVLAHAAVDGGRGLAVQLLVEDRLEQRLEGRSERSRRSVNGPARSMSAASLASRSAQMRDASAGSKGSLRLRPS